MYTFKNILGFEKNNLEHSVCIILINPLCTPVHLALSVKGRYYELNVKGVKINHSVLEKIQTSNRRLIPLLFIELEEACCKEIRMPADLIFNSFVTAGKEATCLQPIVNFLAENMSADFCECKVIFDVLEKLMQKKILLKTYHLHLESYLQKKSFSLPTYSHKEVEQYILKLKNEKQSNPHA
ncbi:MAG: hypothetical protein HND27_06070 [Bacteroidetes bacterium]|nr:hypothetical protein [Bacteroidota bacterium]MBV6459932.1 hypothetical protein [Flavobacteriales bacterium]WKZ76423.1 MAG: hypothetical protein QY303_05875 [Vicingaceae bacterium]MCL4816344.1 hypothetical protein [Flavobacteriales bacterium]NOG95328.1 hypothetical protein [Bacteroidota bacterium]